MGEKCIQLLKSYSDYDKDSSHSLAPPDKKADFSYSTCMLPKQKQSDVQKSGISSSNLLKYQIKWRLKN